MKLFNTIAMIGQGGYAIVRVVKHRFSGRVFALKQIAKSDFHHTSQLRMAITEAEILYSRLNVERQRRKSEVTTLSSGCTTVGAAEPLEGDGASAKSMVAVRAYLESHGHEYFPEFYGSWQDNHFIFFLMEYLPGGDLMKHLMDFEIFSEDVARHYVAQLAFAVGYLHDVIGYAHRDLKPDNILFDKNGNIKLLDFGLSKALPEIDPTTKRRPMAERFHSAVGTPDYMAPEVHRPDHTHCRTVDWWSLGIIMYEMLYGGPPFSDRHHRPDHTARLIRHWKEYLQTWPSSPHVSAEAQDLMSHLIAEHKDRYKTAEEVLGHPWFKSMDLKFLRKSKAPIVPCTSSAEDVRNFDSFSMTRLQEWEVQKRSQQISEEVAMASARQELIPMSMPTASQVRAAAVASPSGIATRGADYRSTAAQAAASPRLPGHFTGALSSLQRKLTARCNTQRLRDENAKLANVARRPPQHATQPATLAPACIGCKADYGTHRPDCCVVKRRGPGAQLVAPPPKPFGHVKVHRAVRGSLTERGTTTPYDYLFKSCKSGTPAKTLATGKKEQPAAKRTDDE